MDYGKILKRAWHILWSYRALWVFGVLVALTTAGGGGGSNPAAQFGGGNNNNGNHSSSTTGPGEIDRLADFLSAPFLRIAQDPTLNAFIWIGIFVLLLVLVFAVVATILRFVSTTSLIRMVDRYEETGEKRGVGAGFRSGWSRAAWRIFLQTLLISLPTILFVVVMILCAGLIALAFANEMATLGIILTVSAVVLFFLSILLIILINIVLGVMLEFFWRASALENLGVFAGIRRGFQIIRQNLKDTVLMWLILFGIKIGYTIAMIPVSILLIPVFILLFLVGALIGAVPGLIVVGISSLFTSGVLVWVLGGIVAAPIAVLVGVSPWILLGGWFETYHSTVWTLAFREMQAKTVIPVVEVEPAA